MMQLDFLQDDTLERPEKPTSSKKIKRPERHFPTLPEKAVASPEILPKLPDSLLAPFVSEEVLAENENEKAPGAFKNISETAKLLDVPQHVLRFWESRFSQIKPLKLNGGRRYYRPLDIEILTTIKDLLYKKGYTINGAKKAFGADKKVVSQDNSILTVAKTDKPQLHSLYNDLVEMRDSLKNYLTK